MRSEASDAARKRSASRGRMCGGKRAKERIGGSGHRHGPGSEWGARTGRREERAGEQMRFAMLAAVR